MLKKTYLQDELYIPLFMTVVIIRVNFAEILRKQDVHYHVLFPPRKYQQYSRIFYYETLCTPLRIFLGQGPPWLTDNA